MSACPSLVLTVAHVETMLDPTTVSAATASVETAVKQVQSDQTLLILHAEILYISIHPACSTCVCVRVFHATEGSNECLSEPCQHGGTCEDRSGSYLCHCPQGFEGPSCEIGTVFIQPFIWLLHILTCRCYRTEINLYCEYLCAEQDVCESSPCLNGGVCRSYRKNYLCVCKDGFFGDQCQMCKCIFMSLNRNKIGVLSYKLNRIVLTAWLCHPQVEDPCILKPCGNRGLCWSDQRGNYNCICQTGHTGKDCEKGRLRVGVRVRCFSAVHPLCCPQTPFLNISTVSRPAASLWPSRGAGGGKRGEAAVGRAGAFPHPDQWVRRHLCPPWLEQLQNRLPGQEAIDSCDAGSGAWPALQHLHRLHQTQHQQHWL